VLDLKQLRYFRAVVEHGSFRRAADTLHISPTALSLSVKALAGEPGISLLDPKPGRVLPTASGHSLYIGTFMEAIEAGQLTELHVPKVDWSSTVALVYRAGETLSPNAGLLRNETRKALSAHSA